MNKTPHAIPKKHLDIFYYYTFFFLKKICSFLKWLQGICPSQLLNFVALLDFCCSYFFFHMQPSANIFSHLTGAWVGGTLLAGALVASPPSAAPPFPPPWNQHIDDMQLEKMFLITIIGMKLIVRCNTKIKLRKCWLVFPSSPYNNIGGLLSRIILYNRHPYRTCIVRVEKQHECVFIHMFVYNWIVRCGYF